jgi:uncharacterized protein
MDMQGSRVLAATQEQAWAALNDPQVLKSCITGCDSIELTGENQYAIHMAVKVGPVSAKFNGKIALADIQPPNSYTLSFEGNGGAAGFGKGSAAVTLKAHDTGCELHYTAKAQVGGKIAQVGQRLIDGVAKMMAEDFFKRFEAVLQERHPPAARDQNATKSIANSQTKSPASSQNGMQIPVWAWAVGAAVIAALVWKFC